jgi:REP element-mobilizing transposase RayT
MGRQQGQLVLAFPRRGGKRRGAGRKRKLRWSSGRNEAREKFTGWTAFHITLRVTPDIGPLRRPAAYHAIREAMEVVLARPNFKIVHVSLETDHVHLIVEAADERALGTGMRAFQISAARRLNALVADGRCGQVFVARYFPRKLGSPTQARNAIRYVLCNWRHHGEDESSAEVRYLAVDYYSSGPSFSGWSELEHTPQPFDRHEGRYKPLPVASPTTWLLRVGWRKAGPISLFDVPGRSSAQSNSRRGPAMIATVGPRASRRASDVPGGAVRRFNA